MSTQTLGIRIAVEGAAQAGAQMKAVAKNVADTGKEADKAGVLAGGLAKQLKQLAGVAVGVMAVREFVQAADAMALLDARLRITVGTGKEFAAAQADIYRISQANNIGLQEATQLYTKLNDPVKRLGGTTRETAGIVDAFATAMRVGGASAQEASSATLQFAQAMASGRLSGDEFRSMAEASPRFMRALADGMGVPIEQLKKLSTEGKLTADVVGNALLKSLAALKTEAQSLPDTVGGALTRLKNDALLAVVAFNDMTGATNQVAEAVGLASSLVTAMTASVRDFSAATTGLAGSADLATIAFGALGTLFETVVLVVSDVAFVLTSIGREIGGIAAQAAALLRGDLAGAKAIRQEMIADSVMHRAELDKFQASVAGATGRVLAQRDALRSNGLSAAENATEMARLRGRVNNASDEYRKLQAAVAATTEANKAAAKAAKEEAALAEKAYKAMYERQDAYLASLAKARESEDAQTQRLRDQYIELVAGKEVLAELINLREEDRAVALERQADGTGWQQEAEELLAVAALIRQQIALRKGLTAEAVNTAAAVASKEVEDANAKAARDAAAEWQRTSDQVGQSLADALMAGGQSAAEYIKNLFRTMVLKPIIQGIVQPVASGVLQMAGLGGGGGAMGAASNLSSLYSMGSTAYGWLGGSAATASQLTSGYAYGSLLASGAGGAGTAGGAGWAGSMAAADSVYAGATTTAAGSVGTTAGSSAASMASYAGWAAAIAAGVYKANSDWEAGFRRDQAKDVANEIGGGGRYIIGSGGLESELANAMSKMGFSDKLADLFSGATAVSALFGRAAPQVTSTGVQGSLGGGAFTGTAYADVLEKGGLFRSDKRRTETTELTGDLDRFFDGAAAGIMEQAKKYGEALGLPADALASVTSDIKIELGADAEANKEALMTALGGYGDALVAGWAAALAPLAIYGETTIQTIERVGAAILSVNGVLDRIGVKALAASVDGGTAAQALSDAFGGLDNLAAASSTYYQEFFTEAERAADATDLMAKALAGVGLAVPASRDAFRDVVSGLDLTTEGGREQFAMLMNVAGAFAELNPVVEAAAAAVRSQADILREREGLEIALLEAQGDTAALKHIERAAIDESNRALYDQITALEAAKVAADATAAAEKALEDERARVAQERSGLERQLLELQGDTAAIRALERAALDESNRALYDQITALEDSQAAAAAAAAAEQTLNAQREQIAQERAGLERQLLQAQGDTVALRNLEREALDESNRALFDQVTALEGAKAFVQAMATAEQQRAAERERIEQEQAGLERQLLQLQGDTNAIRALEREALDATNRALYDQITALQDSQAAAQEAAAAEQALNAERARVAQEAAGLQRQLLQLQGDTSAIRALERAALDATNVGLYDQITALQDAQAAAQVAAQAEQALASERSRVAQEQAGLQQQLLTLQGDTAALQAIERASIDATNLALYDQIVALEGTQAAAAAAAAAEQTLADERARIAQERAGLERELLQLQGNTAALRELERAALDDSNRALYDQITALQDSQAELAAVTQAEQALAAAREQIAQERAGLEVQLLQLQGDTVALRALERAALDETNRALYDQIVGLQDSQAAAAEAATAAAVAAATAAAAEQELAAARTRTAQETASLERQLLALQGDTAALRALDRAAIEDVNLALFDQIAALQDAQAAAAAAATAEQELAAAREQVAQERAGLEQQLLQLQGDTVALRAIERAALDETNRALYDQITALQDSQTAAAAAAQAEQELAAQRQRITQERLSLERRLLELQGDTLALRALDRAAIDESNRALFDQVMALQDAQAAIDQTSQAERALATERDRIGEERAGLELQLLQLQGNTNAIRKLERDALDESNRGLYDKINALRDHQESLARHAEAAREAAAATEALRRAMEAAGKSASNEIERLRKASGGDAANDAGLKAQFAVLTGQARAGDSAALAKLPEVSQALEKSALMMASGSLDVARMRGWLAGSMATTLKSLGLEVPQFAAGGRHSGGVRIVGENGPELEVTGPSSIINAADTRAMLSGGASGSDPAVAQELRALREENKAQALALVNMQARMAKLLERWEIDGMPETRVTA